MKKRALFIDRDGTLIAEPPVTCQVDTLEQLELLPGVIRNLYRIRQKSDFELVMVTNQDGLGTAGYPQENFNQVQSKMLEFFRNEDVIFDNIFIDKSFPEDNLPTRKPGTAMLSDYLQGDYDLEHSFVIGDRPTDVELAHNLGCRSITIDVQTDWDKVSEIVLANERKAVVQRKTKETDIYISLDLEGNGRAEIATGLGFFDHLLEQIAKHSGVDLLIKVSGDLHVDEHHTIEDTGIALGEALLQALSDKRGLERYGFCLPMDDCLCSVALDFGGRPWLVWDAEFKREKIGEMPTEMFMHFFKSLSDSAKMNLNIRAEGGNEHHKIEGIFKSLARAIRMAVRRDVFSDELPSTKGSL
ncbi:MAG: bifunctional histidinol-phosphatase/imidazoleglycerol-phosphate dehydratase HisB [Candidatus Symbiothrix sp.]|jgi:imidazoleglycerol-phosphate dehydratase/histidinol-phosphatase|nr:bifunctional histidinol-phosphatase/imidazoleglycerol-phosphate dehydratase HisB [Candidatus Symbiothrix sp.]